MQIIIAIIDSHYSWWESHDEDYLLEMNSKLEMNETLKGALRNTSYKCIHKMHHKIIQVQCIICMQLIIWFWLFDYSSDVRSRSWLSSNLQWRIMLILEWHLVYQAIRELLSLKQEQIGVKLWYLKRIWTFPFFFYIFKKSLSYSSKISYLI